MSAMRPTIVRVVTEPIENAIGPNEVQSQNSEVCRSQVARRMALRMEKRPQKIVSM